jgi:hypothetical protein
MINFECLSAEQVVLPSPVPETETEVSSVVVLQAILSLRMTDQSEC